MQIGDEKSAITLAERILNLLDEGSFTATYKYAVLIGLLDLCMERTTKGLQAPQMVTTRQLAEKVLELYWSHTLPFHHYEKRCVLRQNTKGQAKILSDIEAFKQQIDPTITLASAKRSSPLRFQRLVLSVERVLIKMPLPRLQVMGNQENRFIYDIEWRRSDVDGMGAMIGRYQRDGGGAFDNRIFFLPDVAENLVILNGLLRPLLYRHWARMVAQINELKDSRLEGFLFGVSRESLNAIRPGLREIQNGRCFYCDRKLHSKVEVDHFVPWSRYPDNGIHNLVAADETCNRNKRDFLASDDHLVGWLKRNNPKMSAGTALLTLAERVGWESHRERTEGVARSLYCHLPMHTMLWVLAKEFSELNAERIKKVFFHEEVA